MGMAWRRSKRRGHSSRIAAAPSLATSTIQGPYGTGLRWWLLVASLYGSPAICNGTNALVDAWLVAENEQVEAYNLAIKNRGL